MALGHRTLATWYQVMAHRLEAGQPLGTALRESEGTGPSPRSLRAMADAIEAGGTVDDALRIPRTGLPEDDVLFLSAAAEVGGLPRILRHLSERHRQLQSHRTRLVLTGVYPTLLLHLGALLFPLLEQVSWDTGFQFNAWSYGVAVARLLIPVWMGLGLLVFIATRGGPLGFRLTSPIPLWRDYARTRALADLAFGLGTLLEAGLRIDRAWQVVGVLTPSPALRSAALTIGAIAEQGGSPAAGVRAHRCFPPSFASLYETGQSTGTLPDTLLRLATEIDAEALGKLRRVSVVYPVILLAIVMAWSAFRILTFFASYFTALGNLGAS
ncbi:MAG: type II secretion system F family protein [Opitutaceae bacterium]